MYIYTFYFICFKLGLRNFITYNDPEDTLLFISIFYIEWGSYDIPYKSKNCNSNSSPVIFNTLENFPYINGRNSTFTSCYIQWGGIN